MVELVDTLDLKSNDFTVVRVQVPLRVQAFGYSKGFFYSKQMAAVYILQSQSINRFYIGSCLDIEVRLIQHKNNFYANSYTRRANDWKLFFSLEDLEYETARKIESHIKKMKSAVYIRNLKTYPEISKKLILLYSE